VAQGAKMCGATKIVGVDLNPAKQELGKSYFILLFASNEPGTILLVDSRLKGIKTYCPLQGKCWA
jgi:Zn-dependent alcohol dehydrogenase